jgi:hypothetical protein
MTIALTPQKAYSNRITEVKTNRVEQKGNGACQNFILSMVQ